MQGSTKPAERAMEIIWTCNEAPSHAPFSTDPACTSRALAKIKRKGLPPYTLIGGVRYPPFYKESALLEMQQQFSARAGDVFLVSNFPIWGLQRVLVALVEGRSDPWAQDMLIKPLGCDADASLRGVQQWIQEANSCTGRRCLKAVAFPRLFPCRYPFDAGPEEGMPAPKIIVLVADPRNLLTIVHTALTHFVALDMQFTELLEEVLGEGVENMMLGNWMEHLAAWSMEAARDPDTVRLVSMDRLGSLDPKEFASELMEIANFVGVAEDAVQRLTEAVFRRPNLVMPPPREFDKMNPEIRMLYKAVESGHLIEQSAKNKYIFEDALSQLSSKWRELWAEMLASASRYTTSPLVIGIAQMASKGVLSLPSVASTKVHKGEAVHSAGLCKPCVFALRGVCRDTAALCGFCHDPSHPRTKRLPRAKRAARKGLQRIRTPSPGSPAAWA